MELDDPIEKLLLAAKERNVLERLGVQTIRDFLAMDPARVVEVRGYGVTTRDRILSLQSLARTKASELLARHMVDGGTAASLSQLVMERPVSESDPIDRVSTGVKARRALKALDVERVDQLRTVDPTAVRRLRGFGAVTEKRIRSLRDTLVRDGAASLPVRDPATANGRPHCDTTPLPVEETNSLEDLFAGFVRTSMGAGRNTEVFLARHGIGEERRLVLQDLATRWTLSRERIRQILKDGLSKLQHPLTLDRLTDFWVAVRDSLQEGNGLQLLPKLTADLQERFAWKEPSDPVLLMDLLELNPLFQVARNRGVVSVGAPRCLVCEVPREALRSVFASGDEEMETERVGERVADFCVKGCPYGKTDVHAFDSEFVSMVAERVPEVRSKNGHLVSRLRWMRLYSSNLRDVIRLVLEDAGEPLHFNAIADRVRAQYPRFGSVKKGNVHGTLGRYSEFSCVSRGKYALSEWNLSPYRSHGRAIVELLQRTGRPMRGVEIVAVLCKDPSFKASNIRATLYTHPRIVRVRRGVYALRDWERQKEAARLGRPVSESVAP